MEDDFLDAMSADQTVEDSYKDEKPFEFGIRLEIDNFSKVPIDEKILSPPCVVHNLAWRIMIKRTEQSGKSRLGYFLVCDPDSTKAKSSWSCEASARLYIINREDPIDHFTREIRHLFCSEENDWGFTTFCYWDYICDPRNKYILNDSVKFDVCIVVDHPEDIDVSFDNFVNVKKHSKKLSKDRKIVTKNENHDALKEAIKRLQHEVMIDVGALSSNLQSEMRTLKSDLMKSFSDQLKTALSEIKLQNLPAAVSNYSIKSECKHLFSSAPKMFVPLESRNSLETESENAAIGPPQMGTGSTVHWFGPSQRFLMKEDDEIEDKLVRLSIDEQKKDEAVLREDDKNVLNDTNEKKRKVEKTIEHNPNGDVKKNKKTWVETKADDNAEISDTSTDDFEIISIDEGDNFGFASDKKSTASFETVSKNVMNGQKSHATEKIVKTDTVEAAATQNANGVSVETSKQMMGDPCRTHEEFDRNNSHPCCISQVNLEENNSHLCCIHPHKNHTLLRIT